MVKNLPANAGDTGSIPGSGRFPWIRKWQPTPVFLPGKSHGQRNLAGYSTWGCKRAGHDLATEQQTKCGDEVCGEEGCSIILWLGLTVLVDTSGQWTSQALISIFFSSPLTCNRKIRIDWNCVFAFPGHLGHNNTTPGKALINKFPLRAGLLRTECYGIFQNDSFTLVPD